MKIYGLDFTSTPSPRKPITCLTGQFSENSLQIEDLILNLTRFEAFETFLRQPGPWVDGVPATCNPLEGWIIDPETNKLAVT